jgi:hypothetical protein
MSLYADLMRLVCNATKTALGLSSASQQVAPLYATESVGILQDATTNAVLYGIQFDDDRINRQIDVIREANSDSSLTTKIQKYVRVLRVNWEIYGPDSFEWSDTMRIRLFDNDIRELFKAQNISLITDVLEPVFVPEAIGQQWYWRYDLSAKFNQLVIQQSTDSAVASANVIIETEKGVVAECSVSANS